MQTVVGVRFKSAGKIYTFGQGRLSLAEGDYVIVETTRGMECGKVVVAPHDVPDEAVPPHLRVVHRRADASDRARVEENRAREIEARTVCEEKIRQLGLKMKLVSVELTFDLSKMLFYFTADGRVDFRQLVRELAGVFRTRIELRQIGVRDEAKMMGGMGCCGRPLCCATFLDDFVPVSIRMAKEQNLSLNPTKISGICGRLMCCLKYESEGYGCGGCMCMKKKEEYVPAQNDRVVADEGEGVEEDIAPHVFDRHVSGHGSTGVGLALAKDLVEADGGKIELSQRSPAVFSVLLNAVPRSLDPNNVLPQGALVSVGRRRRF